MRESFIARGGLWIVAQSVLMLAVLATGVVWRAREPNLAVVMTGAVLLVLGAVLGITGVKALGRNRTPFPKPLEGASLIQHGAYGFVRHPLYTSVVLLSFGWALVWGSVVALAISVVSTVFFDAKARREERWLADRFSEYEDYRRRVRRLIPWVY